MKLTIDGQTIEAFEGDSVLEAADRAGIEIPHLCSHETLPPFGACRLCVVEIEGMRGYPTSCSTPATEGMVVRTQTGPLRDLRRNILELILLEHPSACLVCDKADLCEEYRPMPDKAGCATGCHTCAKKNTCPLRELAEDLGLEELPAAPFYRALEVRHRDPFIDRDMNLCILCGRCVRVCKERHGEPTIAFTKRGSRTEIGPAFGRDLVEAGCRFCGSCVDVCPTGALAARFGKWTDACGEPLRTTCVLCDEGCAMDVASDGRHVVEARPVDVDVPLCALGRFALGEFVGHPDRLRTPRVREGETLRKSRWDLALPAIAERLKEYRGEAFALVVDPASATLEDRYALRKFTAEVMDSPHFVEAALDAEGRATAKLPKGVRAAILTGPFVDAEALDELDFVVVVDVFESAASEAADVVLPAALFPEVDGTVEDASGRPRPLVRVAPPPGRALADWRIIVNLAKAMGAEGFQWENAAGVATAAGVDPAEVATGRTEMPPAAREPALRRRWYRGHRIADYVLGLKALTGEPVRMEE